MKNKLSVSIILGVLSLAALIIAWSPYFVTHIPIEQVHELSSKQAELFDSVITAHNNSKQSALILASVIIAFNLIVTLVFVWRKK